MRFTCGDEEKNNQMGMRGKDFRCEIDPELHERLRVMADFHDRDLARLGAKLLEKAIAGEWHEFRLLRERLGKGGIAREEPEHIGSQRKGGA